MWDHNDDDDMTYWMLLINRCTLHIHRLTCHLTISDWKYCHWLQLDFSHYRFVWLLRWVVFISFVSCLVCFVVIHVQCAHIVYYFALNRIVIDEHVVDFMMMGNKMLEFCCCCCCFIQFHTHKIDIEQGMFHANRAKQKALTYEMWTHCLCMPDSSLTTKSQSFSRNCLWF